MYIRGLKDQSLSLFILDREGSTRPRDIEELEIALDEKERRRCGS